MFKCKNCSWWDRENISEVNIDNSVNVYRVAGCTDPKGGPVLINGELRHHCPRHKAIDVSE